MVKSKKTITKKSPSRRLVQAISFNKWIMVLAILAVAVTGSVILRASDAAPATGTDRLSIYATANAEIGHKEYDSRVMEYTQGRQEAWCADFVSWVFMKAGYPLQPLPNWRVPLAWKDVEGVSNIKDIFINAGGYKDFSKGYVPNMGDVVIFGEEKSHVGIVVSLNGTALTTIEGNSVTTNPNSVVKRTYDNVANAGILGYGNLDAIVGKNGGSTSKH